MMKKSVIFAPIQDNNSIDKTVKQASTQKKKIFLEIFLIHFLNSEQTGEPEPPHESSSHVISISLKTSPFLPSQNPAVLSRGKAVDFKNSISSFSCTVT